MKKNIRKIALILALTNIMSISGAKSDDFEHTFFYLDENNRLKITDNKEFILKDGKTIVRDEDVITIFNEKNISSMQYGASQKLFDNYKSLISNPYIWNILQEYLPITDFPSEQYGVYFYEKFFTRIAKEGCGLAAYTNAVFQDYEDNGNEDEFEKTFGYPMYVINEDGSLDYNYEAFMLQQFFYNAFHNDIRGEKKRTILTMFDKSIKWELLTNFMASKEYNIEEKSWADIRELSYEEQLDYITRQQNRDYKYVELKDAYERAYDIDYNFGTSPYIYEGHLKDFLASFGVEASVELRDTYDYEPGDIVVSDRATIYKVDEKGQRFSEEVVGGKEEKKYGEMKAIAHAVYVVSNNNGKIIVSNWGDKYYYDNSNAGKVLRIRVNVNTKGKIKTR